MDILQHFDKEVKSGYTIYRLKEDEWDDFVEKFPNDTRLCYVDNHELHRLCGLRSLNKQLFLEKYIIPSNPTIKSGDFGEILSFFTLIESLKTKGYVVLAPRKWRWKDDKNKPAPGADVMMFSMIDFKKPTADDLVVSAESKMKAVKSKEHRIQVAINDASKDALSRLAKSINWLEEKYARMGSEQQRKIIERFKDPATFGTFKKRHKAMAIMDSALESDETAKPISNPHSVSVIVFSIKDLKKVYEDVRTKVINSI
jgi:hypothetical protein